jgi:Flp pilus assembly protein TadG
MTTPRRRGRRRGRAWRWLRRFRRDEAGTATTEFVIIVPVFFMLLLMGVDAGLVMTRQVMLDRALDIVVRDLRLGRLEDPSLNDLRTRICSQTAILPNCAANLLIDLRTVNTLSWNFPATPPACVDRAASITPVTSVVAGAGNDMMMLRACMIIDPLFPTTSWGLQLPLDDSGGFQLFALSSFVNEPR